MRFSHTCAATIAICALQLGSARADTITLTAGTADVTLPGGGRIVRLSATGPDAAITGAWTLAIVGPQQQCVHGCAPGDLVNFSTSIFNDTPQVPPVENGAVGSLTLNGVSYPNIAYTGTLTFAAIPVALPAPTAAGDDAMLTSTFTLFGQLNGYQVLNTRDPVLLFSDQVSGHGIVRARAAFNPSAVNYNFGPMQYEFSSVAPTPEPATLLLAGVGLVAAVSARRRVRRTRGSQQR